MWSQASSSSAAQQSGSGAAGHSGTASIRYFIQRHQKHLGGAASSVLAGLGGAAPESPGQCGGSVLASSAGNGHRASLVYSCRSLALAAAAAAASRQRQMNNEQLSSRYACCRRSPGVSARRVGASQSREQLVMSRGSSRRQDGKQELASNDESCTSTGT